MSGTFFLTSAGSGRKKVPDTFYFVCDSAHDALAADFDRDGKLDLAVVCHAIDSRHHTDSKVFYNDGHRFVEPKVVRLPTHGPHWMWQEDMGHIYDRRWQQTYESSVFAYEHRATHGRLEFEAEQPERSKLSFSVRFSVQQSELAAQPWRRVQAGGFRLPADARFLQYHVLFESDNGDRYASLQRVEFELTDR